MHSGAALAVHYNTVAEMISETQHPICQDTHDRYFATECTYASVRSGITKVFFQSTQEQYASLTTMRNTLSSSTHTSPASQLTSPHHSLSLCGLKKTESDQHAGYQLNVNALGGNFVCERFI